MIQRIQSLYLFLTTLLSLLFLNGSLLSFINKSGSALKITLSGIEQGTGGQGFELIDKLLPLSIIIILIPILSMIAIFIFKNRKIQMKVVLILIILSIVLIIALIHVSFRIISKFDATIIPGIKMILPILILVFSILAYMGIRKDDRLVKSYDRLR